MIANTIRQWFKKLGRPSSVAAKGRSFRPRLEHLEDRECPAIFNPADATALVAAITAANTNSQADVINLSANTTYTLTTAIPDILPDAVGANPASSITVNGNGATITRSGVAPAFRIFNIQGGRLFLNAVTISGGSTAGFGGGIRVADAAVNNNGTLDNLVLRNSLVTGNTTTGGDGGGVAVVANGKASVINSTISTNIAANNGGGMSVLNLAQTVNVVNSTIARNVVTLPAGAGGGLKVEGAIVNLNNAIIADNHLVSLAGAANDIRLTGGTLNSRNSLFQETPPGGTFNGLNLNNITGVNPQLGPLQNNGGQTFTHSLGGTSPAVNTGSNAVITAPDNVNDQRGPGFNRTISGTVDIGAYEFQPAAVAVGLTSNLNPSLFRQTVTFSATVAGTAANSNIPQGTVMFVVDGAPLAVVALVNGSASVATSTLAVGVRSVQVFYTPATAIGDYSFSAGASGVLAQTVQAIPPVVPVAPVAPVVPVTPASPIGRRWRR